MLRTRSGTAEATDRPENSGGADGCTSSSGHVCSLQSLGTNVRNVEGSEAAATSKKTELKLTNVAKASQEELLFDYQAFLRQHNLPEWLADSPESIAVRQARPADLDQLRNLMAVLVSDRSDKSDKSDRKAEVAANVMICLINQETFLLGRQLARLEQEFVEEGGFTERLYRVRSARRSEQVE